MGVGDGRGCSDGPMIRIQAPTTDRAKRAASVTYGHNGPPTMRRDQTAGRLTLRNNGPPTMRLAGLMSLAIIRNSGNHIGEPLYEHRLLNKGY